MLSEDELYQVETARNLGRDNYDIAVFYRTMIGAVDELDSKGALPEDLVGVKRRLEATARFAQKESAYWYDLAMIKLGIKES